MHLKRSPRPSLRPFVDVLWATEETKGPSPRIARREHVVPTGRMHLVFRLSGAPLRIFRDAHDSHGLSVGDALVGGIRDAFYIREVSAPLCSVGAQLRPGAARALFGVPADELAGHHTPLEDLWGASAARMREQLADIENVEERLDAFESILAARVPRVRGLHPVVAHALEQFRIDPGVHDAVIRSGYSHRTFIALFRGSVGLAPKRYCRILRLQRALERVSARAPWVDVAISAGYSDQAHFNREFREFVGVTPTEYRRVSPRFSHHLPVDFDRP